MSFSSYENIQWGIASKQHTFSLKLDSELIYLIMQLNERNEDTVYDIL